MIKSKQKNYLIYGIGHALWDMEYRIEDEVLSTLQLTKGAHYLIDAATLHTLQQQFKTQLVHQTSGGSVGNSIATASALGASCYFECQVIADEIGKSYLKALDELTIHHPSVQQHPIHHTGCCVALITPDHERTMLTYLGYANEFSVQNLNLNALAQSQYCLLEGYIVADPQHQVVLDYLMHTTQVHEVKTVLTLSDVDEVSKHREIFLNLITSKKIDLLFGTAHEFKALVRTEDHDRIFDLHQHCPLIVITQGKQPTHLIYQNQYYEIPIYPTQAVDQLGAGDALVGAFLYALQNKDVIQAAEFANRVASEVVAHWGARLPLANILRLKMQ